MTERATSPHPETPERPGAARVDPGADHSAFPALDGLRAVAVAAVVLTHAAYWTGRTERGLGAAVLARMDVGVAVFFVISGFLLFRPWLVAATRPGAPAPSLRTYLIRRAVRILPAYWLAVALCLILLPQNSRATVADWLRHVFLVQIYGAGWLREGLTQTWSLSTEVAFYLLLPVLGALALRWLRRTPDRELTRFLPVCAVLAGLSAPWYVFLHSGSDLAPFMGSFWLPAFLCWFAGGLAMAVLRVHLDTASSAAVRRWQWADLLGSHPLTCWSLAAATLLLTLTPLAGPRAIGAGSAGQEITKALLYAVLAASVAWPAVFGRSPVTTALLGNRVSGYLGAISYGVFLYHLLALDAVMRVLGNPVFTGQVVQVFPLTALGSVGVAALSFRFLERPMIRLGHRRTRGGAGERGFVPGAPGQDGRSSARPGQASAERDRIDEATDATTTAVASRQSS